jgi:hypothetical protein
MRFRKEVQALLWESRPIGLARVVLAPPEREEIGAPWEEAWKHLLGQEHPEDDEQFGMEGDFKRARARAPGMGAGGQGSADRRDSDEILTMVYS